MNSTLESYSGSSLTSLTKDESFSETPKKFTVVDTRIIGSMSSRVSHAQQSEVNAFHRARHAETLDRWEREAHVSVKDKEISLKWLLMLAGVRGILTCEKMGYDHSIMQFVKNTWLTLLRQSISFFEMQCEPGVSSVQRLTAAIEIISSLGVWYSTLNTSLPLRRFLVYFPDENGEVKPHVVVGLTSFSYSSYIMEIRREAQFHILQQIKSLQHVLSSDCLFLPQLLVSPHTVTIP